MRKVCILIIALLIIPAAAATLMYDDGVSHAQYHFGTDPTNFYDEDYSTYTLNNISWVEGYYWANYTLPGSFSDDSTLVNIKAYEACGHTLGSWDYTIPAVCLSQDPLQIQLYYNVGGGINNTYSCYSYDTLYYIDFATSQCFQALYEDAVMFNISRDNPQGEIYLPMDYFNSSPSGNVTHGLWHEIDAEQFNGSVNNVTGVFGQAMKFDGLNDHLRIINPNFQDTDEEMSVSLWIKLNKSVTGDYQWLFEYVDSGYDRVFIGLQNSRNLYLYDDIQDRGNTSSGPVLNVNQWYHVVMEIFNNGTKEVYLNGTRVISNSGGYNLTSFSSGADIHIGGHHTFASGWVNGSMDEVRVYSYPLSAAQVMDLYAQNVSPMIYHNIQGYYTHNLSFSVNASDVYLKNVSIVSSCNLSDYTNTSPSDQFVYSTTLNTTGCSMGTQSINITACDDYNLCNTSVVYWENMGALTVRAYNNSGDLIQALTAKVNGSLFGYSAAGYITIINLSGDHLIRVEPENYSAVQDTLTVNETQQYYNFTGIYHENSINFSVLNERTELPINETVYIEFISDSNVYNYSTSTGLLFVDFLEPGEYVIRYYSELYGLKRHYYYTLENLTHGSVTLYLLNNSHASDRTVVVYNQATVIPKEGAIVYVKRYYQMDNEYRIVAMLETDTAGKAYFDLEASEELYKFRVDVPYGTRRYEGNGFYLNSDTINLYISLDSSIGDQFFDETSIISNITWINDTGEFELTYSDPKSVAENFCFYIKKWGPYSKTIINQSCTTDSPGSIRLKGSSDDGTYYAVFTADVNGKVHTIAVGWNEIKTDQSSTGQMGLFLTALMVIMFSFISGFHILALMICPLGLILAKMMGIFNIDWPYLIGLWIVFVSLGVIIRAVTRR